MASSFRALHCLLAFSLLCSAACGQLSPTFYATTCPTLELIVRATMTSAINAEPRRMGASSSGSSSMTASSRVATVQFFWTTRGASSARRPPAPTSTPSAASRSSTRSRLTSRPSAPASSPAPTSPSPHGTYGTFLLGGPTWAVPLGRRDSTTASLSQANSDLPSPTSSLSTLISAFGKKGLSARDLTALSGAHTIGFSQCKNFRDHIYTDTNIDTSFVALRRLNCPAASGSGDSNLAPLDVQTQLVFDNAYYGNLVARRGLLHSDQELFNGGSQDALVQQYSSNPALFASDFVTAMIKMGSITPLTGAASEVRSRCRVVNSR